MTIFWGVLQVDEEISQFPNTFFSFHYYPARSMTPLFSRAKRRRLEYEINSVQLMMNQPARMTSVVHRKSWPGSEGQAVLVVRMDSVWSMDEVLMRIGIEGSGEVRIGERPYCCFDKHYQYESSCHSGIPDIEGMHDSAGLVLWVITTDYPASKKVYYRLRKETWLFEQRDHPGLRVDMEYVRRVAEDIPEYSRIKEVRYKYVPGVRLPYLYILQPLG